MSEHVREPYLIETVYFFVVYFLAPQLLWFVVHIRNLKFESKKSEIRILTISPISFVLICLITLLIQDKFGDNTECNCGVSHLYMVGFVGMVAFLHFLFSLVLRLIIEKVRNKKTIL